MDDNGKQTKLSAHMRVRLPQRLSLCVAVLISPPAFLCAYLKLNDIVTIKNLSVALDTDTSSESTIISGRGIVSSSAGTSIAASSIIDATTITTSARHDDVVMITIPVGKKGQKQEQTFQSKPLNALTTTTARPSMGSKAVSPCIVHQTLLANSKQLQVQCGKDEALVSFGFLPGVFEGIRDASEPETPQYLSFTCCHVKHFSIGSLPSCSQHMTTATEGGVSGKDFLSHHDLQCGTNKAMTGWRLTQPDSKMRFEFTCCFLPPSSDDWNCQETFFPSLHPAGADIATIFGRSLSCSAKEGKATMMSGWRFSQTQLGHPVSPASLRDKGIVNKIGFQIKCCLRKPKPIWTPSDQGGACRNEGTKKVLQFVSDKPVVWDRSHVLGMDGKCKCNIVTMKFVGFDGAKPPRMCTRDYLDVVSTEVNRIGYWPDCLPLIDLWKSLPDRSSEYRIRNADNAEFLNKAQAPTKLYVDIGANIGACLVQMAARADVPHTLAFEPSQANLFYLTSTLLANENLAKKCTLYPEALGSSTAKHTLYAENGNAGHTVMDMATGGADKLAIGTVMTRTLDEILMSNESPPYIHLVKMDTEGYEVEILKGASKLFASGAVNAVKFEMGREMLEAQGSSTSEYLNFFLGHGFDIHGESWDEPLTTDQLINFACRTYAMRDLVAIWRLNENRAFVKC